jgi:hypothetical protein
MIKLIDILKQMLLEEDRCKRIADRKYDKPSAYKSGAIVRCRRGEIWKDIKEEIRAEEAHRDEDAVQTVVDGKRNIGAISLKAATITKEEFWKIVQDNDLQTLKVPSSPFDLYLYYRKGSEKEANELKDIAEKYDGYFAWDATEEDSRRIGELLGYTKEDIDDYIERNKKTRGLSEEKESLHRWFNRQGAPGKSKGWVDCNTCREVNGKTKCRACGREKGEKRAKYPSCRPTPSACKQSGKGKKWGKTK